jgi:hypothetical protein
MASAKFGSHERPAASFPVRAIPRMRAEMMIRQTEIFHATRQISWHLLLLLASRKAR